MNMTKKNPFSVNFLSFSVLCCLILSVIFFYINYTTTAKMQIQQNQKKADIIVNDLESQLSLLEELALKFACDKQYQPYYFKLTKYNEVLLLQDFKKYQNFSPLSKDLFLHYEGEMIFSASGSLVSLTKHLQYLTDTELDAVWSALSQEDLEVKTVITSNKLFYIVPLLVSNTNTKQYASLCSVIDYQTLTDRFQFTCGGFDGTLTLYKNNELFYCNQPKVCTPEEKDVLTAFSSTKKYTLCYLPNTEFFVAQNSFVLLPILVLTDILLILVLSNIFARKSYSPILEIADRYRSNTDYPENSICENALLEIEHIINNALANNKQLQMQLGLKQKQLHKQFLTSLLEGNYSLDASFHPESQLKLWDRNLYVISISFADEAAVTDEFLSALSDEIETISSETEQICVYTVCYYNWKLLSIICSIANCSQKHELTELIHSVADSFTYKPIVGIGHTYQDPYGISASWHESIDNINEEINHRKNRDQLLDVSYNPNIFEDIAAALANGKESLAQEKLEYYLRSFENIRLSFMMQQYIFSDFLSIITKTAKESHIVLSNQSLSLVISAKNIKNFQKAAQTLLHEFCEKVLVSKAQKQDDEFRIYQYVNTHYTEYDMSLEKIASDLNTSTQLIRQAILKYTKKSYKNYIIYLRMEYAKKLLQKEPLTIAEIGEKVGYCSTSHFIKVFKEEIGITPGIYKTSYQNESEIESSDTSD